MYALIGSLLITAKRMARMPVMAFYLITNRLVEETFCNTQNYSRAVQYRYGIRALRLHMGNIDSLRDWGHAKDYVRMQWMMLQQEEPEDFVIATGRIQYSVREFISWTAAELGLALEFEGEGVDEGGPGGFDCR